MRTAPAYRQRGPSAVRDHRVGITRPKLGLLLDGPGNGSYLSPQAACPTAASAALSASSPRVSAWPAQHIYGLELRPRIPVAATAMPTTTTTGPTTAHSVTPDIALPPTTPSPCSVQMAPTRTISAPAATSKRFFIAADPCLFWRAVSGPLSTMLA